MLFRIIIGADDIRKLSLDELPGSVDELHAIIKDKLQLKENFKLQYADPDFMN